jgi:prepilin-type processing-associated H-X9-DG protein
MEDNLLGYVLGTLDPKDHEAVAELLAESPEAQTKVNLLRQALGPLASDRDTIDPPPDLVLRTIGLIAEHVVAAGDFATNSTTSPVADFVRSLGRKETVDAATPPYPYRGSEASSIQYGRRNLIAGAGLTVALLLIGFTAIMAARQTQEVVACQNNMRIWSQGLNEFANLHDNRLPQIRSDEDARFAWKKLEEAGVMPTCAANICPGADRGSNRFGQPGNLNTALPPIIDYAYTLGYRIDGQLHGLIRSGENDQFPILADAPERRGTTTYPINHRKGQNVLFAGGHVRFCTNPFVGPVVDGQGDDIFFNTAYEPHAGTHRWDSVLGKANELP